MSDVASRPHTRVLLRALMVVALLGMIAVPAQIAKARPSHATTITFLTPPWGIPPSKAALQQFESKSGVTVQINSVPSSEEYSKVQIANATHKAPADVIFLTEEAPSNIVASGALMPLDSLVAKTGSLNKKDIQQFGFWRYKGKQYGITSYVQLVMADYDASRLSKAGFSSPPKTWAQLHSEAKVIKKKGIDKYPVALAAIDWSWYLMALSMGDKMFDKKNTPVFANTNSPARKAMRLLFQFYKEKLITPSMLTEVSPHTIYESGLGTFHQGWEGALAVMNNKKLSKHGGHVKYMLLPDKHYTWSFPAGLSISKYSSNQTAAWDFIKWYLQPAQQKAIYAAVGLVPSRKSVQKSLNKSGELQGYSAIATQSKYRHELPRYVAWWGAFTSYVTSQIRTGISGQSSADSIVDSLAKKWNSLKAQYHG